MCSAVRYSFGNVTNHKHTKCQSVLNFGVCQEHSKCNSFPFDSKHVLFHFTLKERKLRNIQANADKKQIHTRTRQNSEQVFFNTKNTRLLLTFIYRRIFGFSENLFRILNEMKIEICTTTAKKQHNIICKVWFEETSWMKYLFKKSLTSWVSVS